MNTQRVIFLSAVSNEFHHAPEGQPHLFASYRQVLREGFRTLTRHYEVIDQESLLAGLGDLLALLDDEIARSLIVVHLVGELAGSAPEPGPVLGLFARHPDLLGGFPELRAAVGDGTGVTYTQWELYLAFHHGKGRLIFEARPEAPRSVRFAPGPFDAASQQAHQRRIRATGDHYGAFFDQGDVVRKSMRSFLHLRADPLVDPVEPSADALAEAWTHDKNIVNELAASIKRPDPRAVPIMDPANVAAFVAAVRGAAERWHVNLATIVDIAARHEATIRAAAEAHPTPESIYEVAFANLALGDYTAARFWAQRAADLAFQIRQKRPAEDAVHRESAQNALLLLHESAKAARDIPAAIAALEQAGALIDKEAEPLLWADVHEPLAALLLEHAHWDRADDLVSDILDIREERQGENHAAVAGTLLSWARLLDARANYAGLESVARRAETIYSAQVPPDLAGIAASLTWRAAALEATNRMAEAEPLMRQAMAIDQGRFGPEHPTVAIRLNNVAQLLQATNRMAEAEPLMRRALAISEGSFGPDHPTVATGLNNLAALLLYTNRMAEAEPLMRRALAIVEGSFGPEHPTVAIRLNNLAQLLKATNQLAEAETLMRRSMAIVERSFGPEHPTVARDLNNLAQLLKATNRLAEAEPLMRRALAISEGSFGPEHPTVAANLNNLAQLLETTNRLAEAEPLMRRALAIVEESFGPEHPTVAEHLNNLAQLFQTMNRLAEAEPLMRRALAISEGSFGPEHPTVAEHLNNLAVLLYYTNRMAEAEPLMRWALAISEGSFGPEHPTVARDLGNLAQLLQATNRMAEAEPLMRRALAIVEGSFGPEHPTVAEHINNLAQLFQATNRLAEAEPLLYGALEVLLKSTRATSHPHPHLQALLNNYAGLLRAIGRSEGEILARLRQLELESF